MDDGSFNNAARRAGALLDQGDVQGWPRDHPVGFIGYQYFAY